MWFLGAGMATGEHLQQLLLWLCRFQLDQEYADVPVSVAVSLCGSQLSSPEICCPGLSSTTTSLAL